MMGPGAFRWIFFRSISTMVSAGIPLHVALANLELQIQDRAHQDLCRNLSDSLHRGVPFSRALADHPNFFGSVHRFLVRVGEQTGGLDRVLNRLSGYEEKASNLRGLIQSRLAYPAVLFVMAIVMLTVVPAFALEGIFQVIEASGVPQPVLTSMFIQCSRALRNPFVALLLVTVCILAPAGLARLWRKPAIRTWVYQKAMELPVAGELVRGIATTRFAESLSLQLEVGIPPMQALPAAAGASGNPVLECQIGRAVGELRDGNSLSHSLAFVSFFSPLFRSLVAVGEESGKLSNLVQRAGQFYEQQVERTLDAFTALLEPLILSVMGVLFGLMLVATMTPLVQLVQTL